MHSLDMYDALSEAVKLYGKQGGKRQTRKLKLLEFGCAELEMKYGEEI